MAAGAMATKPTKTSYDVVIIGGAIMGSSTAWFLSDNPDFTGSVLVVEKDPSYEFSSTAHTNSCMRQQFSNTLNVQISQFAADFVKNLRRHMGGDVRVPELDIQNYGYLYLADTEKFAQTLRENQQVQLDAGAETKLLSADEIAARYPFYNVDDIVLGSINTKDEGYWDGGVVFDWLRRYKECGSPCQTCANECPVQAIHPTGEINPNECVNCLHCQVLYQSEEKCPVVIRQLKRREKTGSAEIKIPKKSAPANHPNAKTA